LFSPFQAREAQTFPFVPIGRAPCLAV